jgi:S-adenosylmethionine hydrolase
LISDITKEDFAALGYSLDDKVTVRLNKKLVTLPYVKTFMNVPVGDSLLYVDSRGRMAIAINQGNYSKKFGIDPPGTIFIPKKSRARKQAEAKAAPTRARKR